MQLTEERERETRPPLKIVTITLEAWEVRYIQKYANLSPLGALEYNIISGSSTAWNLIDMIKKVEL